MSDNPDVLGRLKDAAMTTDLESWVATQLETSTLPDEAAYVVLAALQGDTALAAYLDDGDDGGLVLHPAATASVVGEPGGVFLSSISVEGFRGIGPRARLDLRPAPGLTVVAGRNGSGKSSLSEALELVLTGDTYRWRKKESTQWREQWRNLHHGHATIALAVVEEANGPVTVTTTWPDDATAVDSRTTVSQRAGHKQQSGLGDLGWERPLEQFRPILSYDELGGLLEGRPSELYDALANMLGVEQLSDALRRIQARHKEAKAPGEAATKQRKALAAEVAELDDDRARAVGPLLKKADPDVDAIRALVTGVTAPPAGPLQALRALSTVAAPPSSDQVGEVVGRLRDAIAGLADAKADTSARRRARLRLLEEAIAVHAEHGDMSCPVCHSGTLDAAWLEASSTLVVSEREEMSEVTLAHQTFEIALKDARALVRPRPAALDSAPATELDGAVAAARGAWTTWAAAPTGIDAAAASSLADHLVAHIDALVASVDAARVVATAAASALDDRWQPVAADVAAWCTQWEQWRSVRESVDVLASAQKWLSDNDLRLKNERLGPIEAGARAAWATLRQESNVELADITLSGSGTRRRVQIDASVDGTDAGGLAVLSQGELHALALSLFLPRATLTESPFRFVVLDDPVQAMDPAKIDGLVSLLSDLAKTRQVVVLSHDDRLPNAVRRAEVDAVIVEVTRGKESAVTFDRSDDPAERYLKDAGALVADDRLPDQSLRRTLPGILRMAVESASRERFFTHRLRTGIALIDVEEAWTATHSTRERVSLAIYGDVVNLDGWIAAPYRRGALKTVGKSMHGGLPDHLKPDVVLHEVRRLVADIRDGAK